jgi:hypothetical protein
MRIPDRITPARWLLEWSFGEGRAAQRALDRYGRHNGRIGGVLGDVILGDVGYL